MKRIAPLYKPDELEEVVGLIANHNDISLAPQQRATRIVLRLHDAGFKVVRYRPPAELKESGDEKDE